MNEMKEVRFHDRTLHGQEVLPLTGSQTLWGWSHTRSGLNIQKKKLVENIKYMFMEGV